VVPDARCDTFLCNCDNTSMKTVDHNELYQHLSGFLNAKGIELKEGTYPQRIRQGCNLLADIINTTQKTVRQAKVQVNRKLDGLRQTIHEATAAKSPPPPPAAEPPKTGPAAKPGARRPARTASKRVGAAKRKR
jgi:hypothetical protein